mmetsp:Transcript_36/g.67  ORF Transcript_36/g.67 Transcript_36/m.67 type:complete len:84 (+) Transcript_36:39-290(+)
MRGQLQRGPGGARICWVSYTGLHIQGCPSQHSVLAKYSREASPLLVEEDLCGAPISIRPAIKLEEWHSRSCFLATKGCTCNLD